MTGCGHEHEDGAYVLGALSPADRLAFERHLPTCRRCRESVAQLAGLPGLLARVEPDVFEQSHTPMPVPDTLLPGLIRRARRMQRRRTATVAGLAAAVVAAVVGVGAVALSHDDGTPAANPTVAASTAAPQRFTPVGSQPISGWVSLTPVGWGTRLDLTCAYTYGDEPGGSTYTMFVTHRDGTVEEVTSWRALPGRAAHVSAGTAAAVADIAEVSVRNGAGRTVLRLHPQKA